jgi:hypothetical protein
MQFGCPLFLRELKLATGGLAAKFQKKKKNVGGYIQKFPD